MGDLGRAIKHSQVAVDQTPENHPDLAPRLNGIGIRFVNRYRRTVVMDGLERAIKHCQPTKRHSIIPTLLIDLELDSGTDT